MKFNNKAFSVVMAMVLLVVMVVPAYAQLGDTDLSSFTVQNKIVDDLAQLARVHSNCESIAACLLNSNSNAVLLKTILVEISLVAKKVWDVYRLPFLSHIAQRWRQERHLLS